MAIKGDIMSQERQHDSPAAATGLRRQLDEALARNNELKGELREAAIERAGFAPDHRYGAVIRRMYDGEPDVEAIQEFAATELGINQEGPG